MQAAGRIRVDTRLNIQTLTIELDSRLGSASTNLAELLLAIPQHIRKLRQSCQHAAKHLLGTETAFARPQGTTPQCGRCSLAFGSEHCVASFIQVA